MRTTLFAAAVGLSTLGCQDYLFTQVCPNTVREVRRSDAELTVSPADILFVVDNSGSMAEEQENLARNFDAFISELTDEGGDYRVAVVTTDQGPATNGCRSNSECAGFSSQDFRDDFPFASLGTNVDQCVATGIPFGCFRSPDGGTPVIEINDDTRTPEAQAAVIQAFTDNVRVGTCGSGNERGLEAMESALAQTDDCNAGFLRPDANLVVVFVSDEPDFSDGAQAGDFERYIEALRDAKGGDLSRVRIASIVGAVDGLPASCRTDEAGEASTVCGNTVCDDPPDVGSLDACSNQNDCSGGEVCTFLRGRNRCVNPDGFPLARFPDDPLVCGDCTSFAVEDCCLSRPGFGYVAFTETVGALSSGRTDGRIDCRSEPGAPTFCLVDAICQEEFSETLGTIARELVRSSVIALDPPAVNVDGVVVQFVSTGPDGERVERRLTSDDYEITPDGRSLRLEVAREVGESLEVFYVTENEQEPELVGACAVDAS
jgi:hypothetical protein